MKGPWYLLHKFLLLIPLLNQSYESKAPLFFEKEPNNGIAVTGKSATFYCKAVAAGKKITYFWKLNGFFINKDNYNGFKIFNGSLHIFDIVGTRHGGKYECIAFNEDLGAIKSRKAMLQIAYFSKVTHPKREQLVSLNHPYLLQAPVYKAFPAPTFVWQYGVRRPDGSFGYVNVTNGEDMFVTLKGDLFFPYIKGPHVKNYKINVNHPVSGNRIADHVEIDLQLAPGTCHDTTMASFPTVTNKTVPEGSNVTFECLAFARSCSKVSINWSKKGSRGFIKNIASRRLVLNDVTKKNHEGTYECEAVAVTTGNKIKISYDLNVIVKPKLVQAVNPQIYLPADGILHAAVYKNTRSLSWYKDGYLINNSSSLLDVFRNGNLRIKYPSPAFSGIYQMFYENQAGVEVASQDVIVNRTANCGWKITDLYGTISYHGNDLICTLLIQVPSTEFIQFNITTYSLRTSQRKKATLFFYYGSTASGPPVARYYFNTTTPSPVAGIGGPFITMIFRRKASNIGGFTLTYGPRPWARPKTTTTLAPTTKLTTTKPSTTSKNLMSNQSSKSYTIKSNAGKTTDARTATTGKISVTVTVPKKKPQIKGGSSIGAIIGGSIGVLILALFLLIIYRKKFSGKFGLALRDQRSSESMTDSQRPPYPDVVPKMRPSFPSMSHSHVGPGLSLADENPCYEPTCDITSAAAHIYEEIGENTGKTETTGRNIPPPTQPPPKPNIAAPQPPEPYYHELKAERMCHLAGQGLKPAYESTKRLTGRTEPTLPPKHKKNPVPYDSIPLTKMRGTLRPAGDDITRLGGHSEPLSSQSPGYQSGNQKETRQAGNRYEDAPKPAPSPTMKRPDARNILYAEPFGSI